MRGKDIEPDDREGPKLTFVEGMVLGVIVESQRSLTPAEVAKVTGFSVELVNETLDELESRGLVRGSA